MALLKWASEQGIEGALIDLGKPWQNGTTESFNGKFRDECLTMEWFRNRLEAKIVIKDGRQHYRKSRSGYCRKMDSGLKTTDRRKGPFPLCQ